MNSLMKSNFLLHSALISNSVNVLTLVILYVYTNFIGIFSSLNPPVFHCFMGTWLFDQDHYNFYKSGNSSGWVITVCQNIDTCLPKIRMCENIESPSDILSRFILPIGLSLQVFSFLSASVLQCCFYILVSML